MNIFHKTEVQKVILRCLTGLYLIWFKSYDTKCSMRPNAILAKSETLHKNLQLINGRFTTIFGHFFANCIDIFHKTEVQTVIFRCLTGLYLNCFKSYDTKRKKEQKRKNQNWVFFDKISKKWKWKFLHFVSQLLSQLSFRPVKHLKMTVWTSVLWKIFI